MHAALLSAGCITKELPRAAEILKYLRRIDVRHTVAVVFDTYRVEAAKSSSVQMHCYVVCVSIESIPDQLSDPWQWARTSR
jgi:hypothetical protein